MYIGYKLVNDKIGWVTFGQELEPGICRQGSFYRPDYILQHIRTVSTPCEVHRLVSLTVNDLLLWV